MQKPLKFESEIGSGVGVSIIAGETLRYATWGHVKLQKGDLEAADGHFREDNIRVWVSFKVIIWLLPLKYSTQAILWWQFGAVKYLWCIIDRVVHWVYFFLTWFSFGSFPIYRFYAGMTFKSIGGTRSTQCLRKFVQLWWGAAFAVTVWHYYKSFPNIPPPFGLLQ